MEIIMERICLLRYDTEASNPRQDMTGFLERVLEVHRKYEIPVTLFCKGAAMEHREQEFIAFFQEMKDDPLFDIQDHSYSHVGVGYEAGSARVRMY
jgi:peptidoglycan/xylan/chitin deacetylase (PgdA/CDA1 family)